VSEGGDPPDGQGAAGPGSRPCAIANTGSFRLRGTGEQRRLGGAHEAVPARTSCLNGVLAGALLRRLAALDGRPAGRSLLLRGAATASLSQIAWWGALAIGFLNSRQ